MMFSLQELYEGGANQLFNCPSLEPLMLASRCQASPKMLEHITCEYPLEIPDQRTFIRIRTFPEPFA